MTQALKRMVCLAFSVLVLIPTVSAMPNISGSYGTYNYSSTGEPVKTPAAYQPVRQLTAGALGIKPPVTIEDLFVGKQYIYLLDGTNACIYLLDFKFKLAGTITGLGLKLPEGLFVTQENEIYIADTGNSRIVVCDHSGKLLREYDDPHITVLNEKVDFNPSKVAVDKTGRIYVVAKNINRGLVELDADGVWNGFIGAPKVRMDIAAYFYRLISTKEQRRRMASFVPTEFNNVDINAEGFVYATIGTLDSGNIKSVVASRDKTGSTTPIKKLNAGGNDILVRNGFFAPVGDLQFSSAGCSCIVDVAVRTNGIYTLADSRYGRIFTYDQDGNLLYVLGGKGEKVGCFQNICAVDYAGSVLLAADQSGFVTVFEPTDYGRCINKAVTLTYSGQYGRADECWNTALSYDANFYTAYVGKGNAEYRQGNYPAAMKYFKIVDDLDNYSKAKEMYRKYLLEKYAAEISAAIALAAAAVIFLAVTRRKAKKKRSARECRNT